MRLAAIFSLLALATGWPLAASHAAQWPGKISLPDFSKPDPAGAFVDLKILGADGSPIRRPLEDWKGAGQRAATDPRWKTWVVSRRALLDDWIAKRHDNPAWVAGWFHDFVSSRDSSTLTFTPDEPGEDTLSSPSDAHVKLTPKLHAAWVFMFRMKHLEMMVEAARFYRLTGEEHYAEWAAGQLDLYANHLDDWPEHGTPPVRMAWQTLDEATNLVKWVDCARILGEYAPAVRRAAWSQKLLLPEAHLLQEGYRITHNIACWHRSAVAQVALYTKDEALYKEAVDGPNGIREQLARGVTSDYLWFEQSMGYNTYVVRALLPFFEYAQAEGRGADLVREMKIAENLLLSPLSLRFPDGHLPNPADAGKPLTVTGISHPAADAEPELLAAAARIFPTALGRHALARHQGGSWDALLDPQPDAPDATLPLVTSRDLESTRMAVIKQGPWQVYLHYGQLTGSHAQAEALNYEAYYGSTDVTHDPGTTSYGAALTAEYFRLGAAHNVPLIDGQGQEAEWQTGRWSPGKLDAFAETRVAASQPAYRIDATASRALKIEGGALIDEAVITATDHTEHRLGFVLNLQGQATLPDDFHPVDHFAPGPGFQHWRDVRSASAHDHAEFDVQCQGAVMRVRFEMPGDFVVYHGSAPDVVPAQRDAFYIETHGQQATLRTVLGPRPDAGAPGAATAAPGH